MSKAPNLGRIIKERQEESARRLLLNESKHDLSSTTSSSSIGSHGTRQRRAATDNITVRTSPYMNAPRRGPGDDISPLSPSSNTSGFLAHGLDPEKRNSFSRSNALSSRQLSGISADVIRRQSFSGRNYLLHVRVVEGNDLEGMDSSGLSDPYCRISLGKVKHRTKTIAKDLNPIWDQAFSFPVFDMDTPFELTCHDRDKFARDDFLGRITIDVSRLLGVPGMASHGWYQLYDKKEQERRGGMIYLKMCLRETYGDRNKVLQLLSRYPQLVVKQQQIALNFQARDEISRKISVGVGTWNMGNQTPPDDLSEWIGGGGGYDLVAICTQKTKYKTRKLYKTLKADWISSLEKHLGSDYHLAAFETVGTHIIAIFVHSRHRDTVYGIRHVFKTFGIKGDKAIHGVSIEIMHTRLCFFNTYFHMNDQPTSTNQALLEAMKTLKFPLKQKKKKKRKEKKGEESELLHEFHHVFWVGDFGFPLKRVGNENASSQGPRQHPSASQVELSGQRSPVSGSSKGSGMARRASAITTRGNSGRGGGGGGLLSKVEKKSSAMNLSELKDDDFTHVINQLNDGLYGDVFLGDVLQIEKQKGNALWGFRDGFVHGVPTPDADSRPLLGDEPLEPGQCHRFHPNFPPTAPVIIGDESFAYDGTCLPTWSDRILWKSLPGSKADIKQLALWCAPSVCTSNHKPVFSSFEIEANYLHSAIDARVGQCSVSFLSLSAKNLNVRGANGLFSNPPDLLPSMTIDAPCFNEQVEVPVKSKPAVDALSPRKRHKHVVYEWSDQEVKPAPLKWKFNNKTRLKREHLEVTVRSTGLKGQVIGKALIPLTNVGSVEILHDDVFNRWCTHFRFDCEVTKSNLPVGSIHGILQIFWEQEAMRTRSRAASRRRRGMSYGHDPSYLPDPKPDPVLKSGGLSEVLETVAGSSPGLKSPVLGGLSSPEPGAARELGGGVEVREGEREKEREREKEMNFSRSHSNLSRITKIAEQYNIPKESLDRLPDLSEEEQLFIPPPPPSQPIGADLVSAGGVAGARKRQLSVGSEDEIPPPPTYPHPADIALALQVGGVKSEEVLMSDFSRTLISLVQKKGKHQRTRQQRLASLPNINQSSRSQWQEGIVAKLQSHAQEWNADELVQAASMLRFLSTSLDRIVSDLGSPSNLQVHERTPPTSPKVPRSGSGMFKFESSEAKREDEEEAEEEYVKKEEEEEEEESSDGEYESTDPTGDRIFFDGSDYETDDDSDAESTSSSQPPLSGVPFPFDSAAEYEQYQRSRTLDSEARQNIDRLLSQAKDEIKRSMTVASGQVRQLQRDLKDQLLRISQEPEAAPLVPPTKQATAYFCKDCQRDFTVEDSYRRHMLLHGIGVESLQGDAVPPAPSHSLPPPPPPPPDNVLQGAETEEERLVAAMKASLAAGGTTIYLPKDA